MINQSVGCNPTGQFHGNYVMSVLKPTRPDFDLGRLSCTQGALLALNQGDMFAALTRHMSGDWGEVDEEDWEANDRALETNARLLSAYIDRHGKKFWIITQADRSSTTILLPEEY
jgi:predicted transcriptional regulator